MNAAIQSKVKTIFSNSFHLFSMVCSINEFLKFINDNTKFVKKHDSISIGLRLVVKNN